MGCCLPGSSVHGDSPVRIPECVAMQSSRTSSQPRDRTQVSLIAGRFFTSWATREAQEYWSGRPILSPGELSDPGIELGSSALQADSLPAELPSYVPLTVEDTDAQHAGYCRLPLQTFFSPFSALCCVLGGCTGCSVWLGSLFFKSLVWLGQRKAPTDPRAGGNQSKGI